MILLIDLIFFALTYFQIYYLNRPITDRDDLLIVFKLFGRQIFDQKYESDEYFRIEKTLSDRILRFVRLNYHLMGLIKKILLFLVLVGLGERFETQIYLVYTILGVFLVMGGVLRTFKTRSLNYLKLLSDATQVGIFVVIHLCDEIVRSLEKKDEEELKSMSDEELEEIANRQKSFGYLGVGLYLLYCFINLCLYLNRSYVQYQELKKIQITDNRRNDIKKVIENYRER